MTTFLAPPDYLPAPRAAAADPLAEATALLARHGKTFALAGRFLAPHHRRRATLLYGFCRQVDDWADRAEDRAQARRLLLTVRDDLHRGRSDQPATAAMLALMAETAMPVAAVTPLLDGVLSDFDPVRIASEAELVRYGYQVAGSVGLMMCAALDVHDPVAHHHAIDLGIAMQLTNIARDVAEDARDGRIYLPATWTGDLSPPQLLSPGEREAERLQQAIRRTLELAEDYYDSGIDGLGFLPPRAGFAIYLAAQLYRAIGHRIAANGFRSWQRREQLSSAAKVLRCGWHALTMPRLAIPAGAAEGLHHRQALHRHLQGCHGAHPVRPG